MLTQRKNLEELMAGMEAEFHNRGQAYRTQLFNLKCCQTVLDAHEAKGLDYLSGELIAEYTERLHERFGNGSIGEGYFYGQLRNIRLLLEYDVTGKLSWKNPAQGSRYKLNDAFERIAGAYLLSVEMNPNTHSDARWVTHKYFAWLAEQGYGDVSDANGTVIQRFIVSCSKTMSPASMHDIKLHMKKLYAYLSVEGLAESSYEALLSFKVNRESKIYPCVPKEDIAALLDAVDRNTRRGKRDYAMLLLGVVLGLRAIDIINLKLGDIDWLRGEIKIVQAKTNNQVVLPLTEDLGGAIKEYILKARPNVAVKNVFLRMQSPYKELRCAVSVGDIYNDWRMAAGLPSGRNFHALRRTLGRDMVTSGTPVTTVAQVLGQRDINSTKKYIPLDSRHLKLCALPFEGIAPNGGERDE